MTRLAAIALLILGSCVDYEVHENDPELSFATRTIDFDEVVVGHQAEMGLAVQNIGRGVLRVESVELDGTTNADYTLVGLDPMDISPNDYGTLVVRYTPDLVGQDYGTITLVSNDPVEPIAELDLMGFGVEPRIDVDPETLWFGDVLEGASETLQVEVAAAGTGTTIITDIFVEETTATSVSFELAGDVTLPYRLAAGFSFNIGVTFAPTSAEELDTYLLIESNDPTEPTAAVRLLGNSDENPVDNEPPTVEITDPDWGNYVLFGEPVALRGMAIDPEDGPTNLTCTWLANGQVIGVTQPEVTGAVSYTTAPEDLPEGQTTITLMAFDTAGEVGTDSVTVTVFDPEEPLRYTITGGTSLYDYWYIDDDIVIEVDGVEVFRDENHDAENHPPLEFDANVGSEIHVVATDYDYCKKQLDSLYLHWGSGEYQVLNEDICGSACTEDVCYDPNYTGPWPNIFLNATYVIEIPTAR